MRGKRRWWVGPVRSIVLAYLGVAIFLATIQAQLIFPGAATQGRPESAVAPPRDCDLVRLPTAAGDEVVALFGPALTPEGGPRGDAATCPTILYFYGNAMCLNAALPEFDQFRRLGANVLIPDYLGYGMSGGTASELACRATAEAALAHLRSRPDVDPGRIVAAGWSLGGAVAIDLAARQPVAGVVSFCTFTRMADMARRLVPFLPTSLLPRHRFDNEAKVAGLTIPILIGHGRRDRIIPFAMADRLAQVAPGPVARVTIDEADHNDFFAVDPATIDRALQQFITNLPRQP